MHASWDVGLLSDTALVATKEEGGHNSRTKQHFHPAGCRLYPCLCRGSSSSHYLNSVAATATTLNTCAVIRRSTSTATSSSEARPFLHACTSCAPHPLLHIVLRIPVPDGLQWTQKIQPLPRPHVSYQR